MSINERQDGITVKKTSALTTNNVNDVNTVVSQSPYYANPKQESDKNYQNRLFIGGRGLQARELTNMGFYAKDLVSLLGNTLYKNGYICSGCSIIIREEQKEAIVSSGQIFYDGIVRNVDGTTLRLDCVGEERIGVKLVTSIITEAEDPSLVDPAPDLENTGMPGSHILKEEIVFSVNDDESVTIFTVKDGKLIKETQEVENSQIIDLLARRTYDENGNYKVDGLDLSDGSEVRDDKIVVRISEGKAYIEGYEVQKQSIESVLLNKSTTTRGVRNETRVYKTATPKYYPTNQPVANINGFTAPILIKGDDPTYTPDHNPGAVVRGSVKGGSDLIPLNPVRKVVAVFELQPGGSRGKTYRLGEDYLLSGDYIDWSPAGGSEPVSGSTYYVEYYYNKELEKGVDYDTEVEEDGRVAIKFLPDGDKPQQEGSSGENIFTYDYEFYLSRKDLVLLDKKGKYQVLEGVPEVEKLCETPYSQDDKLLPIASILVLANSTKIKVNNFSTTRLTQDALTKLKQRVERMEFNLAMTQLDKEAQEGEDPMLLNGIFTDGFADLSKADIGRADFNCTIDVDLKELTLPTSQIVTMLQPNVNSVDTKVGTIGRVVMAPFEHEKFLFQQWNSNKMLVNPYAVFKPLCPIKLVPEVDNWVDTETMVVNQTITKSVTLRRWWWHKGEPWAEEEKKKWDELGLSSHEGSWVEKTSATNVSTSNEVVADEAILYMRSIPVTATGHNFNPNATVEGFFNDNPITLKGVNGTQIQEGKAIVKEDGSFEVQFTVPPKTPCGSVNVKFVQEEDAFGYRAEGSAIYKAQGRKQVIKQTVLTEKIIVDAVDPLAQSFIPEEDVILTRIGVYFSKKDNAKAVVVQVRDMVNGYPGTKCYAEVTVPASQIKVSEDGSLETIIDLPQPVYCFANVPLCFAVLSDSNEYEMHFARLGERDVSTGAIITAQPYSAGVMFSSSNAMTWTAHQTDDLKFNLYKCKYTGQEGQIVFDKVSADIMTKLVLAANSIDYKNAGITWHYRFTETSPWLPIDTYVEKELGQKVQEIYVKAVFKVKDSSSPIMATDCVNLVSLLEGASGTYITKQITVDDPFKDIKISLEDNLNYVGLTKDSLKVFYYIPNTDDDKSTIEWTQIQPESDEGKVVDVEFARKTYVKKGLTGTPTTLRIKIEMSTKDPLKRVRARKLMVILTNGDE